MNHTDQLQGTHSEQTLDASGSYQKPNPVEPLRLRVLSALRDNQPLVVLTSLSLAIGAFSQSISPDAVSYAVSAGTAFFSALAVSILLNVHEMEDSSDAAVLGVISILAIALGFVLLGLVVWQFSLKYPLVGRVVIRVAGSFFIVSLAIAWVYSADNAQKLRQANPQDWKAKAGWIRVSMLATLLGIAVVMVWWVAALFFPDEPDWVAYGAGISFGVAIIGMLYTTRTMNAVRKAAAARANASSVGSAPQSPQNRSE